MGVGWEEYLAWTCVSEGEAGEVWMERRQLDCLQPGTEWMQLEELVWFDVILPRFPADRDSTE